MYLYHYFAGTGKTYTMLGTSGEPGIMGLTLNDLFKRVNDTKDDAMYSITMAYLEVHFLCMKYMYLKYMYI